MMRPSGDRKRVLQVARAYLHQKPVRCVVWSDAPVSWSPGDGNGAWVRVDVWVPFNGTDLDQEADGA